jgi:hypothetical protein
LGPARNSLDAFSAARATLRFSRQGADEILGAQRIKNTPRNGFSGAGLVVEKHAIDGGQGAAGPLRTD